MGVTRFRDLLPPFMQQEEQDPNRVLSPILDAFGELEEERIWTEVALLSLITSIEFTTEVDILLENLGNPFAFIELTETQKRRVARSLVDMYRLKGTAVGIEQAILLFIGLVARVISLSDPGSGVWVLGVSELGVDTELGASLTGINLFTFIVEFDECLTTEQEAQVEQIIVFMKPSWTRHVIKDCINPTVFFELPFVEGFEDVSWLP